MSNSVVLTERAKQALKEMDWRTAALLIGWMRKNLEGCENPRRVGKPLAAGRIGQWRYRVGDYRLIAEVADGQVVILELGVGRQSEMIEK